MNRMELFLTSRGLAICLAFLMPGTFISAPRAMADSPDLDFHSHFVDDDDTGASSGNGDGVVNCDETIELLITLENTGDGDAHTVRAILSTNDPFVVEITDSSEFYPDIPAGETATCIEDFDIVIAPDCPDGHQIAFDLSILADEGFWNDSFVIISGPCGGTPTLSYSSHVVDDDDTGASSGNGDGVVNCDETIELLITLANTGDGDAHEVGAILSTDDPYVVEITDSSEFYPDIPAGETATCIEDFDIVIAPDCPEGHQITFDLSINAAEGFWSDSFFITVGPCSICGNGVCDSGEDSVTCCDDCGPVCGDAACNCGEDSLTCCEDCGAVCGDGTCNCDEDTCTCPLDCGSSCGDGCCNGDEDTCDCCVDCGTACPDGCCSTECGEDEFNCPEDCCGPYTIGGFVYDDCENPGTSGMQGVTVCVDCQPGFQNCTDSSGSAGSWQIPDVPCGTCTVTAALNLYDFCHVVDACPPDPCEGTAVVIVDSTHEQENLNIEFLGVALPPPECDEDSDCDDADPCTLNRCVNEQCVYPPASAGTACGDPTDDDCTNPDSCDGAGQCQANHAPAGTPCGSQADDECTAPDTCNGEGICLANDAPVGTACGDPTDNDCTDPDTCDGDGLCESNHAPPGSTCGDPTDNECTDPDSCDGTGNCLQHDAPTGTLCGDPTDDACTDPDSCDGTGNCLPNNEPDGTDCDDGLYCNGAETCAGGICQGGTAPDCNDGIDCTDDACNEATDSCDNVPNDAHCPDDGLFCNGTESCDASSGCVSSGDPCPTGMSCNETTDSCEQCQGDSDCDDGVDCTDDTCVAGACVFTPNDAHCPNDGQFCNGTESCDASSGCISSGDPCPAGMSCNESTDRCEQCQGDSDCDDGVNCTDDTCVAGTCVFTPNDADCPDDDLFCNGTESCDASSGCVSSGDPCLAGKVCNEQTDTCEDADLDDPLADQDSDGDGVPDTADACPGTPPGTHVDANGCACHQLDRDGDDVDDCGDRCPDTPSSERVNEQGCSCSQIDCDDDDSCTIDSCLNGNCINAPIDCDDGDSCTEDNCLGGLCQNTPIECPDDTECVDGECVRFWTLTVRLQPGDVGRPPPEQWLQDGTLYSLPIPEPAAESLYVFDHWEGSVQPAQEMADILEILMDSDKTLTAVYRAVDCLGDDESAPDMYCLEEACVECRNDDDCADDGLFCNGTERCADGACIHEGSPCPPTKSCDEDLDTCCVPAPCGAGCGCTPDAPMVGIILFGLLTLRFVGRRAP
ncbi:MAG: hypothetical protein JSV78_07485 [Phycisphaerales bacterium]|nr:MAG: hypothetical protein JSV78_07485 [Phycisphaerales bacterium]